MTIEWDKKNKFLQYEYAAKHLQLSSKDPVHCSTHAVGGKCEHVHDQSGCKRCLDCVDFFSSHVLTFLKSLKNQVSKKTLTIDEDCYHT